MTIERNDGNDDLIDSDVLTTEVMVATDGPSFDDGNGIG